MALVAADRRSAPASRFALSRLRGRAATAVILAALLSAVVLVQTPASRP
ncbi:MAG: hypothetical protein H6982_07890 [Chromatiales bacterium]|nr:hypothetical protein [Chromatiales bacterium]